MEFDVFLFRLLNGLAGRHVWLDAFLIFCASYVPFLMIGLTAAYVALSWKTSHFEGRVENVVHAAWAVAIGFIAQCVVGFLWFRPRPFVTLTDVVKLVQRAPGEKSFPSAHATFVFALAFAIALHNKKWGAILLALAVSVAFGRVATGVHYPSDVLFGAVVGLTAALGAAPMKKWIEPYLDLLSVFRKYRRRDV